MSDQPTIEALLSYAGALSEAAVQANAASAKQHQLINGDAQTDVLTESGPVPTHAKQARLYLEAIPDAVADLSSQMADGRIHSSEAVGRPLVSNGQYFYALSTDLRVSKTLWRRIDANSSQHIVDEPSSDRLNDLEEDIGGIAGVVTGDPSEYAAAFVDKSKRIALGVKKSGGVTLGDIDDLSGFINETRDGTLEALGAVQALESDVGAIAGVVTGDPSDYAVAFVDRLKKIALGVTKSGQVTLGDINDLSAFVKEVSSNSFQTVEYDSDFIASWVDQLKQIALAITKAGNVVIGGNLVFNGDLLTAEGQSDSRLDRGFLDGRSTKRVIVCPGDSMTNGYSAPNNSYPKQLAALLPGRDIVNLGISSNTSVQIASRMGAVSAKFSVVGGTIPRSGVVTLTAGETPSNLSTNSMDLEFDGTLFGVPGKLHVGAGAGTTAPTFTRANAGDVVHVPDNSPFVLRDVGFYRDSIQVIWSGRNDGNAGTVLANIAKMVSLMPHSRFIVLSVCTRTTETSGTSGYTYVNGLNAQLKSIYPNNYLDVLTPLIAAYNPELPGDVTAHAGNTIPPSLSTDGTHLVAAGFAIVAQLVADVITQRGF